MAAARPFGPEPTMTASGASPRPPVIDGRSSACGRIEADPG
jgi:hypothetical protein